MISEYGIGHLSTTGVKPSSKPYPLFRVRNRRMDRHYGNEALGLIKGGTVLNAPMHRLTSMKVGGPADALLFPGDVEELKTVVRVAKRRRIPIFILGNGTNLVVRDRGIRGWVICLTKGFKKIQIQGQIIESDAGVPLRRLVRTCMESGLSGLEPLFGIPGTVGGAVAMNAGAWGAEIKDLLLSVTFLNSAGRVFERDASKLKFRYRSLDIPASWIILKGRFQLRRGRKEDIAGSVKSYSEMRKRRQPAGCYSAGSIFRNPKEGPAGKWIEETGLKGFRIGDAMVSERHANFIINLGKATADEIIRLMEYVERKVYEEKEISLQREVRVVGE